jgi:hypothetical protein
MRPLVSLDCLLAATSAAAGSFECTLDGAPWTTKAPFIFLSSAEGRPTLYVQVNANRSPSLSLAVDWAPLKGPGKAVVDAGASDGGPPAIAGNFSERYEKPVPTPEDLAAAERRRVRVIGGRVEWEATGASLASLSFSITAASADGKGRRVIECRGADLPWQTNP